MPKPLLWYTDLNGPSSQEAGIPHRPVGLKLRHICLVNKVFLCKLSLTLERMPGIWQMLVGRLIVVYKLIISKMKVKTVIGGNLLYKVSHGCKIVMFKATQN